ncbi:MAG: P1 family peptidase [Patescibacteria group bacterium]
MDKKTLEKLGLKIGHFTDLENLTGSTVFIAEKGAEIGIEIRGSWPGFISAPYFGPKSSSTSTNSIILAGGSTHGMLESVSGAFQYMEEKGIGIASRSGSIPYITASTIYDLSVLMGKKKASKKDGYEAAKSASYSNVGQGNIGVGTGATTGKWFKGKFIKGGFGIAVTKLPDDILVGAFVVTNSVGDVVNPNNNKFYSDSGDFDLNKKIIDKRKDSLYGLVDMAQMNTTLAVIATNAAINNFQLMKVAELAHDGMARSIMPVHTMMDGDIVFAVSSHNGERKDISYMNPLTQVDMIGLGAADALMKAIKNSILNAKAIDNFPAYKKTLRAD